MMLKYILLDRLSFIFSENDPSGEARRLNNSKLSQNYRRTIITRRTRQTIFVIIK